LWKGELSEAPLDPEAPTQLREHRQAELLLIKKDGPHQLKAVFLCFIVVPLQGETSSTGQQTR
jgi:hypothetical protein